MLEYKVIVYDSGTIAWFNKEGQFHCEHGPAFYLKNGYKAWYKNDMFHNLNGPAVIYSDGKVEYWINDEELTEDQFKAATAPVKELTVSEIETLLGYKVKVIKENSND